MSEPITINGRKTLLIGLGTTGAMVCNQILEKIAWTHGSPENIPWVKIVVLETAHLDPEKLVTKWAKYVHLKIAESEYANLIANPQNFKSMFDFPSWDIPQITGTHNAIENGADNIRIMGRLAFLFNYMNVKSVVSGELNALVSLTEQQASAIFSEDLDAPASISFAGDEIHVVVVGTLCGGTASGSFIDLGYFFRSRQGYNLKTTSIMLLPSQQEHNEVFCINAYSSLIELNHFSDDRVKYRVQYPDSPSIPWEALPGMTPFGHTYLVQCRGAGMPEYAKLVTSTADYIYTDLIGSSGLQRDAKRTNISQYFVQRDLWGANQKFFTFGLAVIEFPFAKVYKACSLLLAKQGLQKLISGEPLTETQSNLCLARIPAANRTESIRQLITYQEISLIDRIARKLGDIQSKAADSPELASIIRNQIDLAFGEGAGEAFTDLPSRIVPQTIESNTLQLRQQTRDGLTEQIQRFLTTKEHFGIQALLSFLNRLTSQMKTLLDQLNESTLSSVVVELRNRANFAQDQLIDCHRDQWLRLVAQSRRAKERYAEDLVQALSEYYEQRLYQQCTGMLRSIYTETLATVEKIKNRLEDPSSGLLAEATSLIQGVDDLYQRTDVTSGSASDGWSRSINGTELFNPGETVEQEYQRCLIEEKEQRGFTGKLEELETILAIDAVQGYVQKCLNELLADPSRISRYDKSGKFQSIDETRVLELVRPARYAFHSLKSRSIVQRILAQPDCNSILQGVRQKSELFLGWNSNHPRHRDQPNKSYGFVFYDETDSKSAEFYQELLDAKIIDDRNLSLGVSDSNQILILRERGAFSLGTVQMLIDEQPSNWRNAYQIYMQSSSCHSRGDIDEWTTWSRQIEEERAGTRSLFLVAIALEIIKFKGAQEYHFDYQPMSPSDSGFVRFNNDLDEAASRMRKLKVDVPVYQKVREFRELKGPVVEMDLLKKFIIESDNKFTEAGNSLSRQNIEDYLLDYIFSDEALLDSYSNDYPDLWERSLLKMDEDGQMAYYCPYCNGKLGYSTSSLYIMANEGGRTRKIRQCAYCGKTLERPLFTGSGRERIQPFS